MILNPGEFFGINWNVSDPSDTNVYYPQATVQNSRTMDVINVLDLTSADNIMYHALWQIPQDGSGLGFHIVITIKVYTDSAHTTLSQNYQIESRNYLVQERLNRNMGMGYTGNENDLDWEKLKKVVSLIVKEIIAPLEAQVAIKPKINLSKLDVLEDILGQLGKSIAFNDGNREAEVKKIHDKLSEYDKFIGKVKEIENILSILDEHSGRMDNLKGYLTELDGHNADVYEKMAEIVKSHASQSKKYIDGQLYKFGEEMKNEMKELFDGVEMVQITGKGTGLKKLAEKENPMDKYHKIAEGLV